MKELDPPGCFRYDDTYALMYQIRLTSILMTQMALFKSNFALKQLIISVDTKIFYGQRFCVLLNNVYV